MQGLLESPATWVAVAFVLVLALAWKPLGRIIARSLDARSDRITKELDEAMRLKKEAETILAQYQKRQAESLVEAERILKETRADVARMRAEGEAALKLALKRREDAAVEKIAQAETKAKQEVQNHLVDLAVSAARAIVTQHLGKATSDDLVKRAISDVEHKIH